MNKVVLMGRLTKDPEIRATQDGKRVASYTLAVDRKVAKQEQKADFISCTAWEKKAEFAEKYLSKGMKIAISGRLQTGSYTDRNGNTVYTTDVVVEDQEFCEKKAETIPDGLEEMFRCEGVSVWGGEGEVVGRPGVGRDGKAAFLVAALDRLDEGEQVGELGAAVGGRVASADAGDGALLASEHGRRCPVGRVGRA